VRTTNAAVRVVRLRLICDAPPTGVGIEFGLQDKAARLQPGVREPDGALRFEADVRVVRAEDGGIRLRGSIVHGPPTAPFLYLSCRPADTPGAPWILRLKVPLTGVDAGGSLLEARVRATAGGSVPLIGGGWAPA
jgi:hypothetical protein